MSEQHRHLTGQSVAGRYLLGNYLGGTEHSAVFATEIIHARSQRVAIKLIPVSGIVIARQLARWKALAAVSHPNLLKIVDYGKCDLAGAPYLYVVMEHADEDLADILPQRALNAEETRAMMEPVIETLSFLHEQNLVHTRLHPGNILATGDQIKLSSDSITPKGEGIGLSMKVEGFSPLEWGPADPAGDIWSLGATVVATLTQNPPLIGEDGGPRIPTDLPEPFAAIVRESLKMDPAQRTNVLAIRGKLNPASVSPATKVAVEVAKEPARKEPPRIDPVAVPISRVSPPIVPERRPSVPEVSPARSSAADEKKSFLLPSYLLPISVVAAVVILMFALPKLLRQKSDAAPAVVTTNSTTAEKRAESAPVSTSKATLPAPKKNSTNVPAVAKTTSQPTPATAPPMKMTSKSSGGDPAKGEVLDQVLPDVSDKARGTIRGTVRISVRTHVNPDGTVNSADLDSPAISQYFSEQAIKAAKRWQFSAPEVAGRSVASDWLLRFEFTSSKTNVHATQVSP